MSIFSYLLSATFLLISLQTPLSLSARSYEIIEVTNLGRGYYYYPTSVLKINNKGNVIGLRGQDRRYRIFFYDYLTKSLIDLESLNENYYEYPLDLNDDDTIIGYTDVDNYAVRQGRFRQTHVIMWKNFQAQDLTSTLGIVVDQNSNRFISMNNSETLAGFGFELSIKANKKNKSKGSVIYYQNQKKKKATPVNSGDFFARLVSINERNDAAGGLMFEDGYYYGIGHDDYIHKTIACIWDSSSNKIILLGNLTNDPEKYSFATNLNDTLQVVGSSEVDGCDSRGQFFWHAFLWDNSNLIDLGTLQADEDSSAESINNIGEIVGVSGGLFDHPINGNKSRKGFYWTKETGMRDLNSMIGTDSGWNILSATDINDSGQIVAFAQNQTGVHVVILNPLD